MLLIYSALGCVCIQLSVGSIPFGRTMIVGLIAQWKQRKKPSVLCAAEHIRSFLADLTNISAYLLSSIIGLALRFYGIARPEISLQGPGIVAASKQQLLHYINSSSSRGYMQWGSTETIHYVQHLLAHQGLLHMTWGRSSSLCSLRLPA